MGDKILDLRRRAEALNEFTKLPRTISHRKLGFYPNGEENWEFPSRNVWSLKLEAVDGTDWTMHKNNCGRYRLAYVLDGWEGEEQALPFGDDELVEMKQYGTIMFSGGIYGDDIGEMVYRMKKWIEEQNNKTQAK